MAELQALFTPRPASPSLDPSHDPRAPEALRAAVGPSEEGKPPGRGVRWRVWMDHPLPSHPEPRGAVERGCRALLTLANLPWVCAWSLRCVQLCGPMDSSLPDSSVHGILQARILECTFLLFTAMCKAFSDNHFAFLHFFFLGMVLIPVSCTMSRTSVHSSSGTLSIRSSPLNLFLTSTV